MSLGAEAGLRHTQSVLHVPPVREANEGRSSSAANHAGTTAVVSIKPEQRGQNEQQQRNQDREDERRGEQARPLCQHSHSYHGETAQGRHGKIG